MNSDSGSRVEQRKQAAEESRMVSLLSTTWEKVAVSNENWWLIELVHSEARALDLLQFFVVTVAGMGNNENREKLWEVIRTIGMNFITGVCPHELLVMDAISENDHDKLLRDIRMVLRLMAAQGACSEEEDYDDEVLDEVKITPMILMVLLCNTEKKAAILDFFRKLYEHGFVPPFIDNGFGDKGGSSGSANNGQLFKYIPLYYLDFLEI